MSDRSCFRCGCGDGQHDPHCPLAHPEYQTHYNAGYIAGRVGEQRIEDAHPAWLLGWRRGDIAADEAADSVPWSQ